jgi:hypothetical protein
MKTPKEIIMRISVGLLVRKISTVLPAPYAYNYPVGPLFRAEYTNISIGIIRDHKLWKCLTTPEIQVEVRR